MTKEIQQDHIVVLKARIKSAIQELLDMRDSMTGCARHDLDRALHHFRASLEEDGGIGASLPSDRDAFGALQRLQ